MARHAASAPLVGALQRHRMAGERIRGRIAHNQAQKRRNTVVAAVVGFGLLGAALLLRGA